MNRSLGRGRQNGDDVPRFTAATASATGMLERSVQRAAAVPLSIFARISAIVVLQLLYNRCPRCSMRLFAILIAALCSVTVAYADDAKTEVPAIRSLLRQDFMVVGAIPSPAGPGVFLQKKDQLFLCFASETRASPTIATQYCKPVE